LEQKTDAQKTILIVEDEKNIVDILRFNLQREGYRTVEAYDGADGLEKARKENPDLILLDVMLPKMIGFDVCRTQQRARHHPHRPGGGGRQGVRS
jgi:two-component system response regulator VicR